MQVLDEECHAIGEGELQDTAGDTVEIAFTDGEVLMGSLSADGLELEWEDESVWQLAPTEVIGWWYDQEQRQYLLQPVEGSPGHIEMSVDGDVMAAGTLAYRRDGSAAIEVRRLDGAAAGVVLIISSQF